MARPLGARVRVAFAIGFAIVAIVGSVAYLAIESLVAHSGLAAGTYATAEVLQRVVLRFQVAESLQRKYLVTGTAADLDRYQDARTDVTEALRQALSLPHDSERGRRLDALGRAIGLRMASMERAAAARRDGGTDAAVAIVGSDANRLLAREIDGLVSELRRDDDRRLAASREIALDEARMSRITILLGTLLSLGLLAWAIVVIARYQADRLRVEAQLRESEERSRAITENMADGVLTTDEAGTIVEANAAAKQLFGYPGEELIGRELETLLPARHREGFRKTLEHLRERRGEIREPPREMRVLRKDGSSFYVNASFSDVRSGGKRLFSGLIRDVSDRIRMTRELKASEAQLRQVTDAVPALIAYVDSDVIVRFNNKAYEEFFGLDRERILGCKLEDVVGAEIFARLRPHVEQALAGFPVRYERSHTMPSGEQRYMEGHFFPRYGEGAEHARVMGFYSLVTDITALKRLDQMKSEFVSTVSHELRTPLTSIRGSLGLMAGGVAGALPEAARKLVDIAKSNCERLIRLINEILDTEKIESGKMHFDMKALELRVLLDQALAANEGFAAQHQVRLALASGADGGLVSVDADRLIQVITNLLSNAVKFSPAQSVVEVMLTRVAGRLRVAVRDHGPGIPQEFRGRLFQKFSQADSSDTRVKGGTGLGLNISRSIVERFAGSIGFESREGEGTTFFFELPELVVPDGAAAAPPSTKIHRLKVLICEDDPDIARLIAMLLDRAGIGSDVAHDAAMARGRLALNSYDAITVDLRLPGEDGISLIRSLRSQPSTHALPVLVLSAEAEEGRIHLNNESLSVAEWLQKPIDENHLVRGIRNAIEGNPEGRTLVLHVEDDPDIQRVVAAIAVDFAAFEFAGTLAEARAILAERRFDLVLLDLALPDGCGVDLLHEIRARGPRPRVVIFSATDVAVPGADAVLVKSVTSNEELLATIERVLEKAHP